jgi:hypothetical protein
MNKMRKLIKRYKIIFKKQTNSSAEKYNRSKIIHYETLITDPSRKRKESVNWKIVYLKLLYLRSKKKKIKKSKHKIRDL